MNRPLLAFVLAASCLATGSRAASAAPAQAAAAAQSSAPAILHPDAVGKLFPATVYFRGQTAPVQIRNSAGVRFSPDAVMLAALVDTSGYSSAIQDKYQAYLITETPLQFGSHTLAPGAYGVGFLPDSTFLVMDLGGHDLFTAPSAHDPALHRPTPLQILDAPATHSFRLYEGRNFVEFTHQP